ncbi:MAG: aldehyde dehydrogenase family protein [Planctomycetes bacterium]|nr:aldehyde dehydrogenase family protein [Planctomycetota bacterium]
MTQRVIPATLEAVNPATGEKLGEVPVAEKVSAALAAARAAQPSWADVPIKERMDALRRVGERLLARQDKIARVITQSTGKPLVEAYSSELFPAAGLLDYFARFTRKLLRSMPRKLTLMGWAGRRSHIEYRPVGTVAVISPWNYPFSIPLGDVAIGLAAGCTVVLKPSEAVPLVGEEIRALFEGLPVWVVQGPGQTGAELVEARPDKIFFTGGGAIGRRVMEAAAKHLIPVVLELGGKDPMIVCADADLDLATDGAVWGCFTNSGQVCASVKRAIVVRDVAERFTELVVAKTKALRQGDPLDPDVDVGAMTVAAQIDKVEQQVKLAVAEGARVLAGGRRLDRPGFFFQPTVLGDVDPASSIAREEVFGPVLPILIANDEEDAVRLANDSPFGLTASVWSKGVRRARAIARRLQVGTVMINDATYTHALAETPWGGVKESGFGRTHGLEGLLEFVTPLHINENRRHHWRSLWWFPYDERQRRLFTAAGPALYGHGRARWRAARQLLANFSFGDLKPRR